MTQIPRATLPGKWSCGSSHEIWLTFGVRHRPLPSLRSYPVARYSSRPNPRLPGGASAPKDETRNTVTASVGLSTHKKATRSLVQGLKGDPT